MYGHEFKELRLEQGITQKEVCRGICSESKLSRWENDQVEVEFSTAMKLLIEFTLLAMNLWVGLNSHHDPK